MIDLINKGFGKKTGSQVSAIFAIIIVIAVIFIGIKIYKGVRSGSKVVGNQIADNVISIETGISAARVQVIRAKGISLFDDHVDSPWYNLGIWNYDEEEFIQTINSMVNTKELALLDDFYHQTASNGEHLKDAIDNSFDGNDKARLRTGYLGFLNTL